MPTPRLPPQMLRFLRGLKRNNRRDWFAAHRDDYEQVVRAPMIRLIEQLGTDFRAFAPELTASAATSLYRIHRDIRFSANKAPYKTHVAAAFPHHGLSKHEGACLYFHVSPEEAWVGGGMYAPNTAALVAVREHLAANVRKFRAIVESPGFRRTVGALKGERLQRIPRGFPRDHDAGEYLRFRQFLAGRTFPASHAVSPRFYASLLKVFREVTPLVRFLNEPLVSKRGSQADLVLMA